MTEDADTEVARESGRLDLALVAWLHEVQQLIELDVLPPGSRLKAETPVDSEAAPGILRPGFGGSLAWA